MLSTIFYYIFEGTLYTYGLYYYVKDELLKDKKIIMINEKKDEKSKNL